MTVEIGSHFSNIEHRFPKGLEPVAPEGMIATKFHGNVAFISEPKPGETRNKAGFTPTQANELLQLEAARVTENLEHRPTHFFPIEIVGFKNK